MKKTRSLHHDVDIKILSSRLNCTSRIGTILRDNGCRGNLKELDLEYLVILGHGVVDGIVVAGDHVVLLGHNILADKRFLLCGVGLSKSSECSGAKKQDLPEN